MSEPIKPPVHSDEEEAAYRALGDRVRAAVPDPWVASEIMILAVELQQSAWRCGHTLACKRWEKLLTERQT